MRQSPTFEVRLTSLQSGSRANRLASRTDPYSLLHCRCHWSETVAYMLKRGQEHSPIESSSVGVPPTALVARPSLPQGHSTHRLVTGMSWRGWDTWRPGENAA